MNKLLLSMAAVGALAAAAPAAAQWTNNDVNAVGGAGIANRIAQLDARLQAGINAGVIDRVEARTLRAQLRQLTRLEGRYSYNGLTQAERADLRQRLRTVRQNLRVADNGRFDRDTRYSWDDRFDNEDVLTQRLDRNGDGWEDRDYDRDGRIDRVYTGQGGPYEQPYDANCDTNRTGIGGLISGILGRDDNCTLRVGMRATGNLYAVPSHLRYQFRDGNGVYYRSDGRQIYQIDARTNTVLRVYSMDR
jgi:hypothetical protein